MKPKIPLRFFVITFLWTWLFTLPWTLFAFGIIPKDNIRLFIPCYLMHIIGAAFGPAVGAFVSLRSINGKGAVKKYLKSFLSFNFGWKVWLAMFLFFGISHFVSYFMPEMHGLFGAHFYHPFEDNVPTLPDRFYINFFLSFTVIVGGGLEEVGWRGYILPFLEKRFGLIIGSLILGIIWAVWHVWYVIILGADFFGFMLTTIGLSYFLSWVIQASGNRLLSGVIVHGLDNAFITLIPRIIPYIRQNPIQNWIYCSFIFLTGIIIVAIRTIKKRKTLSTNALYA